MHAEARAIFDRLSEEQREDILEREDSPPHWAHDIDGLVEADGDYDSERRRYVDCSRWTDLGEAVRSLVDREAGA